MPKRHHHVYKEAIFSEVLWLSCIGPSPAGTAAARGHARRGKGFRATARSWVPHAPEIKPQKTIEGFSVVKFSNLV